MVLLALGFSVCIFLSKSQRVWTEMQNKITYEGRPSPASTLYLSDGRLLIDLRGEGDTIYIVNPETRSFGIPNSSSFTTAFGYAFSKDSVPPMASAGKAEMDPELRVEPYLVEFTSLYKKRVSARWVLNR